MSFKIASQRLQSWPIGFGTLPFNFSHVYVRNLQLTADTNSLALPYHGRFFTLPSVGYVKRCLTSKKHNSVLWRGAAGEISLICISNT